MPDPTRQTRKRLATRQSISDAATRLFFQHGFDRVTVDQIAEAADVSRMTVFNHFARKEDMFFDLDAELREALRAALDGRTPGMSPVEALDRFVHRAVAEEHPYARFFDPGSAQFMATVSGSEALKARARAIRDELADLLTAALTEAAGRVKPDPEAHLAAHLLLAAWTVALLAAHRHFVKCGNLPEAKGIFAQLADRGRRGVDAALHGTPYV